MDYHITIQGHLDQRRSAWFTGMTITNTEDGVAILSGSLVDQAALYGVLMKLRDLGMTLIAVQQIPSRCQGRRQAAGAAPESYDR